MDVTATLTQMMGEQEFKRAPLHPEIFPIGYQNSPKSLEKAVGRKG